MTKLPPDNLERIKQVLGSEYLDLKIEKMSLDEDFANQTCRVRVQTTAAGSGEGVEVEGEGVGVIDALFHALLARYAVEYKSLESITFAGFSVKANLDSKSSRAGADSVGEVVLIVRNSEGRQFEFSDASRSVTSSAARAVLAAVEYFVNAERAFITLYNSRKDAKERNRPDLVARFTHELAEVVQSTSYAEVIEKLKKDAGVD